MMPDNKEYRNICRCHCHVKGSAVMHFMPCCRFTYEKYLNEDGSIDLEVYKKLVESSGIKVRLQEERRPNAVWYHLFIDHERVYTDRSSGVDNEMAAFRIKAKEILISQYGTDFGIDDVEFNTKG